MKQMDYKQHFGITNENGFSFEEIGGITKDLMLEKADAIKADFGY